MGTLIDACALKADDQIIMRDVEIKVLRDQEPHEDVFGRKQVKYWAKRLDTEKEGWIIFGPGAKVAPAT